VSTNTDVPALPEGYRDIPEEDRRKAKKFFEHGRTVAASGQYEYAISMYIDGLALDPEDLEAHKAVREISLKRKVSGGKAMGMFEARKYSTSTRDDKQNMLNSEKKLAFEPGNIDHMIVMVQSAHRAGFYDTALWMADLAFRANLDSAKPEYNKFIVLRDVYKGLNEFKSASDACSEALRLRPNDMDLQGEMKNLAAQYTMSAGKYNRAKSFRESMRDQEGQQKLLDEERDVRSDDFLTTKIRTTETEWRAAPDDMAKFGKFIDALRTTEQLDHENRAIELLDQVYQKTKNFRWRQRAGEIKLSQLSRMERTLRGQLQLKPDDVELKKEYDGFVMDKIQSELDEYKLRTDNYPTDSEARFEMARRMFALRQFQDVIPVFQQVRNDPKYRASAGTLLGRAFYEASFFEEASETLKSVIDEYAARGDEKSKDMTYWYGRALEAKGDEQTAIKQYSLVAQWDFKYKDVQERIKTLRAKA